jgi:hypothetical protein
MKKKITKLSVVKQPTEKELDEAHDREREKWEQAEKGWRITAHQMRQRVLGLRDELERYREQLDAVPFGIPCGDASTPPSLDGGDRKYTIYLAMDINPLVDELFEYIDAYAKTHGPTIYRNIDFQSKLFDLRDHSVEAGFKVGILAGAIFSGAPKEVVDRFERGLAFDMKCDSRVVKD